MHTVTLTPEKFNKSQSNTNCKSILDIQVSQMIPGWIIVDRRQERPWSAKYYFTDTSDDSML